MYINECTKLITNIIGKSVAIKVAGVDYLS